MTVDTTASITGPGRAMLSPGTPAVGRRVPVILAMLVVLGPASMDLHLPVLAALARDLGSSTSSAQLTMTTCLLDLALGQMVAGPVSDRYGRRRPLIAGLIISSMHRHCASSAPQSPLSSPCAWSRGWPRSSRR